MSDGTENCRKIEEDVYEDRISALPEDLLVHILLFVPTKDAVTTTVLSKRWSCIWKILPKLVYKDTDDDKSVWWFLDKSLQFHKAPVLQRLEIELGSTCPVDADLVKWIDKAVERCIQWLEFNLLWSAEPLSLSNSFYTCKTLTTCISQTRFSLMFLPKLPSHHFNSGDEDSLFRLLSSCPVLHHLFVDRDENDNVTNFCVKVPSLGLLWYQNLNLNYDDDVGEIGGSLVIDSPLLSIFDIDDCSGDTCLVESMLHRLNLAVVDVVSHPNDNFLRSLSSIVYFHLTLTDATDVFCSAIKFSQLKECKLAPLGSQHWMVSVKRLLHNSPKLKVLMIDSEYVDDESENHSLLLNQRKSVPKCLKYRLKIFEWDKYGGTRQEKQVLTYILANTRRLKTVRISPKSSYINEKKEKLMEELKSIPRVSESSQLLFSNQFTWRYGD